MNRFKNIILLAVIVGTLLFTGCKDLFAEKKPADPFDVTPPFYRAADAETGGVVYMLGAMHIGKDGAVYPQSIYSALDESDTFVTEVDVQRLAADKGAVSKAMEVLLCERGTTTRDFIGSGYDEILKKFRAEGIYNSNFDKYLPTTWTTQWSNYMAKECGYSSDFGTDRAMLAYAKEHGRTVEEMETAREQYQIDANASIEYQVYTLKNTLSLSFEETKAQLDDLFTAWKNGDEAALGALVSPEADGSYPEELKDDYADYYNAMYAERQKKMADIIVGKLKAGEKAFVMAGALHFVSPPSILERLAENGYEVENLTGK